MDDELKLPKGEPVDALTISLGVELAVLACNEVAARVFGERIYPGWDVSAFTVKPSDLIDRLVAGAITTPNRGSGDENVWAKYMKAEDGTIILVESGTGEPTYTLEEILDEL